MGFMEVQSGPQGGFVGSSVSLSLEGQVRQAERFDHSDLVASIAAKYIGRGVAEEELVRAGQRGLALAIRGFSAADGMPFVTFASWWIKDAIRRAISRREALPRPVPGRHVHTAERVADDNARGPAGQLAGRERDSACIPLP